MELNFSKIIDLSHEISANMPIWPEDPKTEISIFEHKNYSVERLCIGTHSGTHVGTPKHFGFKGSVIDLSAEKLFLRAIVVDVSHKRDNFVVDRKYLIRWEGKHSVSNFDAVLLRTRHDEFWNDKNSYFSNYAGFGCDAIEYLLEKKVKVFGTDAPGIDPSNDENFSSNREIFKNGGIHLENLTNLEKLPTDRVFWIFVGALKIDAGGSPARIVAFI